MIKAIIFDYYGVLTTDQYMSWLRHNPSILDEHAAEIEELSKAQDRGLDANEFYNRLGKIAGLPASEVRDDFGERNIMHLGLIEYIRRLRDSGLKTAILSNSSLSLYDEVERHHLSGFFDEVLCSEEAGMMKPDPAIFNIMLERLGVEAGEAVFVDDRAYNVKGAAAVGMTGIYYTDLAGLRADLIRCEVKLNRTASGKLA